MDGNTLTDDQEAFLVPPNSPGMSNVNDSIMSSITGSKALKSPDKSSVSWLRNHYVMVDMGAMWDGPGPGNPNRVRFWLNRSNNDIMMTSDSRFDDAKMTYCTRFWCDFNHGIQKSIASRKSRHSHISQPNLVKDSRSFVLSGIRFCIHWKTHSFQS